MKQLIFGCSFYCLTFILLSTSHINILEAFIGTLFFNIFKIITTNCQLENVTFLFSASKFFHFLDFFCDCMIAVKGREWVMLLFLHAYIRKLGAKLLVSFWASNIFALLDRFHFVQVLSIVKRMYCC